MKLKQHFFSIFVNIQIILKHPIRNGSICLAFLIGLFFSICVQFAESVQAKEQDFLSYEQRQWLETFDGKIRVAPDPHYPPVEYFDENGLFRGITADYLRLIEKKLGYKFQIVQLSSFDEILEKARNREIDVVSTVIQTEERSEYLFFTSPYIRIPNVLVVNNNFDGNLTVKDLRNIKGVVYQEGYTIGSVLVRQYGINHAEPVSNPAEALRDLSTGRINVMAGNLAVISHYIRDMNLANLRIAGDCKFDDIISFGSRKDWPVLNQILEKVLREITSKEREAIRDSWIKVEATGFFPSEDFWFGIFGSLCLGLVILMVFYFWNRMLKKQVLLKSFEVKFQEEALHKSEEKYRCLVENANEAIVVAQNGRLVFVNPMCVKLTGYMEHELKSKNFLEFIHPDDRQMVFERHKKRLEGNFAQPRYSFRIIRKNGHVRWVEINVVMIDWEGSVATLNFINDVTARKLAQEAMLQSEKKYRMLIENTQDIIYTLSEDGIFTYVSPSWTLLLGHDIKNVEGKDFRKFVYQEDIPKCEFFLKRIIEYKEPQHGIEYRALHIDGSYRWHTSNGSPLLDNQKKFFIGVARDMTERKQAEKERKKLEAQLLQAQKMESVGRLAGGVSHDFNNMLAVIIGHTELLMDKVDLKEQIHDSLSEILSAAKRSAELTSQLLAFARRQNIIPQVLDLNETVEGMLKMLRRIIGENIDLVWVPENGLWQVHIDPAQIDQILVNLCVNAKDSIAGFGKITIETHNVLSDGLYSQHDPDGFFKGEYVVMEVRDTGCGMDKSTLNHLFEPFFTTKAVGKGTGLGLATVYGTVKQNNGFINVFSEPGEGATFRIYLPRYEGDKNLLQKPDNIDEARGGDETILLVEDEVSVMKLGNMILEKLGYTVLPATAPKEAVRMAMKHAQPIDLLITDVVMPEMNGKELAENLQEVYPDLRVLFMSGYTADVIAHHGILDEGVHFLQKPFSGSQLAMKTREILKRT